MHDAVNVISLFILGVSNGLYEHSSHMHINYVASIVFFLRARAVVKFFLRAASTLESTDGEQRAL